MTIYEPTETETNDACMWYRHDFGLLQGQQRAMVQFQAKEWLRAWHKATGGLDVVRTNKAQTGKE